MSRTINYKTKYKKALERARVYWETDNDNTLDIKAKGTMEYLFPELADNESDRIKAKIIALVNAHGQGRFKETMIAWLEKQGTPNQVSIWKHWKDGIAGNGEGKPIYLIKAGNTYNLSSCLSFECDYIELSELDNLILEKIDENNKFLKSIKVGDIITKSPDGILINLGQSDRALEYHDKFKPKFKVGDWINGYYTNYKVLSFNNKRYIVEDVDGNVINILFENEKFHHLWSIKDAKEGDILANDNVICVYKERISEHLIKVTINYSIKEDVETHYDTIGDSDLYPATKAQRDFFISKILQK